MKIRKYCKRFIACLMICFTLTFTTTGNYLGAREVYATGITETLILKALIEAIMASMGLSFSSTTDLNNAAAGLNSAMNQYEDYSYGTASPFKELQEQVSSGLTLGMLPSFCFTQTTYKFLQNYCYNLASEQVSSASDVVIPFVEMSDVSSERISFSSYSESELLNKISYGKSIHANNSSGSEVTSVYKTRDSDYYDITQAKMIVSQIMQYSSDVILLCLYYVPVGNSCAIILNNSESSYVYVSGASVSGSGSVSKKYSTGISEMNYYLMSAAGTYGDKSSYSHIYRDSLFYDSANDCFYAHVYSQYSPFLSNKEPYGLCFSMQSYNTANYNSLPAKASSNSVVTVYFNSDTNTTVYSSWEEYQMMAFTNAFRPSSRVYGTSATAKAPTADGTAGTITFELKEPTMTSQVEQAVNNALAANPSITEEELNAVASDVIAAQNGTTDAVNQNTATLSTILTTIKAQIDILISTMVTAPSIASALATTFPWMRTLDTVLGDQLDAIRGIPESLTTTFPWMQTIDTVWGDIYNGILDIPKAWATTFPWMLTFEDLLIAIPGDIAKALSDGLALDLDFPDILDYTSYLERIIELLSSFFVIDTALILEATMALAQVWADKLPIGDLLPLYESLDFSDNYNYPVIKMQTPKIFQDFYKEEYIVFIDFADYAKEMLWCRNLVKALFWFSFGLSLFKHLRVDFHVG